MSESVLVVNASAQPQGHSTSRQLVSELLSELKDQDRIDQVIERDLSVNPLPLITAEHIGAYYTPEDERSDEQKALLVLSDELISELKQSDVLVIGTPMYNFSVPASLKAWIDLICRVGETFRYTENGPEGLLDIKKAYIVVSTGGAPVDSPVDFVVPYLKQVASFIGVKDVKVIAADRTNADREAGLAKARNAIAVA